MKQPEQVAEDVREGGLEGRTVFVHYYLSVVIVGDPDADTVYNYLFNMLPAEDQKLVAPALKLILTPDP